MSDDVPYDRNGGLVRKGRVLIVDDDRVLGDALAALLSHAGCEATSTINGSEALAVLRRQPTELVLLDLRLGAESGLDLLVDIKKIRPEISVIIVTALGTIEAAVDAMRSGADNFVLKPLDPPRLLAIVSKGLEARALRARTMQLERNSGRPAPPIVGESAPMDEALRLVETVAAHDTTVLLNGETGTGKGLFARYVHDCSARRKQPFVELNCAGLHRELTESELFGHEKGAFTGATERKLGLFEAAAGGTLFLDEIGELDSSVQAKLLRAIEEKTFRRIGGLAEIEVDVRLIAATHRDLAEEVKTGRFREDLFYRLSVFTVELPPLRERREDVGPLTYHFLRQYRPDAAAGTLTAELVSHLEAYDWPGNVRELRNVVERACILAREGPLRLEHLPRLQSTRREEGRPVRPPASATMRDAERHQIERALSAQSGNVKAAAEQLGISRATLYRKARKYNIPV
jgi:two-component system, NtrC family, response regulator HydG